MGKVIQLPKIVAQSWADSKPVYIKILKNMGLSDLHVDQALMHLKQTHGSIFPLREMQIKAFVPTVDYDGAIDFRDNLISDLTRDFNMQHHELVIEFLKVMATLCAKLALAENRPPVKIAPVE